MNVLNVGISYNCNGRALLLCGLFRKPCLALLGCLTTDKREIKDFPKLFITQLLLSAERYLKLRFFFHGRRREGSNRECRKQIPFNSTFTGLTLISLYFVAFERKGGSAMLCNKVLCFLLSHVFGDWKYFSTKSCKQERKCLRCGKPDHATTPPVVHDFGKWRYTTRPNKSCKQVARCKRCSEKITRVHHHNPDDRYDKCLRYGEELHRHHNPDDRYDKCLRCGKKLHHWWGPCTTIQVGLYPGEEMTVDPYYQCTRCGLTKAEREGKYDSCEGYCVVKYEVRKGTKKG